MSGEISHGEMFAEELPPIEVSRLTDRLGFGDGAISRIKIESQPGNEDLAEVTDRAVRDIDNILVPVGRDKQGKLVEDDGCGDGRGVDEQLGAIICGGEFLRISLDRPKVFGGGAAMTVATQIGLGKRDGRSMQQLFEDSISLAGSQGMEFGAHTDGHAHGDKCGCGAIDNAPAIARAAAQYREQIRASVALAMGLDLDKDTKSAGMLDEVLDNFAEAADADTASYAGRLVMEKMMGEKVVVKRLADDHKETRIIVNTVEGYTVDQRFIRQQTGDRAQAFAVDMWRKQIIAERLYAEEDDQRKALYSELVYMFATAAVLTRGDQPVDVIGRRQAV